jgi:hypothetical protein
MEHNGNIVKQNRRHTRPLRKIYLQLNSRHTQGAMGMGKMKDCFHGLNSAWMGTKIKCTVNVIHVTVILRVLSSSIRHEFA